MNEAKPNTCRCNQCPGSSCKCGCQNPQSTKACGCDKQCKCGGACTCKKA